MIIEPNIQINQIKGQETYKLDDIFDLMISNNQRYNLLLQMNPDNQFQTIKRLMDIYRLYKIKKLEKFFIFLCIFDDKINLYLKQELLYILSYKITLKNKFLIKRSFLNVLFIMFDKSFKYNEFWLMLKDHLILYNEIFKDVHIHYLLKNIIIIFLKKLNFNESIKKIFSLILCFKKESFFIDICIFIFKNYNKKLEVKNNLFLLQIIFKGENTYQNELFSIINNSTIDLNLRLEACDILYLKGTDMLQNKVQEIIKNILPDSSYIDNPENTHLSSIVKSVEKTLDSLLILNKDKLPPSNLHQILLNRFSNNDKIKGSLNRIFNYNFLKFSKYKLTLKEIIEHIYIVIDSCDKDLQHQLYIRLEQELTDMYDTCSQGYTTRLINIFTGFEINDKLNLGITISYEDEIYAIFSNKVNNLVLKAPELVKNQLLEELMVPSNQHEQRLNLTRYLRPHLSKIWNEIFDIFKDELTTTDLDLYCRKVTMKYEGY